MTTSIDFDSLDALKTKLTMTLQDYSGSQALFSGATDRLSQDIPFEIAGAKGNISGQGSIELFNSKDDKDADGVLVLEQTNPKPFELSPAIQYNNKACWLKYAIEASIKGTSSHSLDDLDIGIDSNEGLRLLAYRKHTPSQTIADAVVKDLKTTPLISDIKDVLALQAGEAVALIANAKLTAQAEFKWSDILAQNMSKLSQWLDQGELLNLKIDASVNAKINVTIEGGFKLIFSRDTGVNDKIRLAMKKSSGFGLTANVGAKITAQLSNQQDFKQAYTASIEAIFAKPLSIIEKIKQATSVSELPEIIQGYAEGLMDRLGVSELDKLKEKITKIESDLTNVIKKAAVAKAELSFAYEYERLTTHQSLCELIVSDAKLKDVHKSALSAKLLDITALANGQDIVLKRFFYQDSTSIKSSWGFNLGFGNWSALSSNYSELEFIEVRNANGARKLSTIGMKGYKDTIGSDKRNYYINFEAEMPEFVDANNTPKVSDFALSLSVVHVLETKKLSQNEAFETIDNAAVWGIIPFDEIDEQAKQLKDTLSKATNIKIINSLNISAEVFPDILKVVAAGDSRLLAKSLAAALPRVSRLPQGRANPSVREQLYTDLLEGFVTGKYELPDHLSNAAKQYLKSKRFNTLARREGNWRNETVKSKLLGGVASAHPDMSADVANLTNGMARLYKAYNNGGKYTEIEKSYRLFDDMGEHGYYNRFFVNYLLRCAGLVEGTGVGIECSVKVEFLVDGVGKEVVFGRG